MTDKLRVHTDKLITAVEKCLKTAEREDVKAEKEYARTVAAIRPTVVKVLQEATQRARRGELPGFDGYSRKYHLEVPLPDGFRPPREERDTRHVERIRSDLAMLKASSQGSILVEAGDRWTRYLREAEGG